LTYQEALLAAHAAESWSWDQVEAAHEKHSLFTWTAHDVATKNALHVRVICARCIIVRLTIQALVGHFKRDFHRPLALKLTFKMVRAEGVYFWDQHGKRYIDWNSMAMNMNHGHTPDKS
jgi:4-aminobutyrate aminotransferase-like enzyme